MLALNKFSYPESALNLQNKRETFEVNYIL